MLDPHYYVTAAQQEGPEGWTEGGVAYVPKAKAQAERAAEMALSDAEKYRTLLQRAIRNSTTNQDTSHEEAYSGR